jgi:hypothetical protein
MEWKEFILIIFGSLTIITFLFTAQSMFMISKLESVNITFEIKEETREFINDLQNKSNKLNVTNYLNELAIKNNCSGIFFQEYDDSKWTCYQITKTPLGDVSKEVTIK